MNNGSKKLWARILAFVMIVSTVFTNLIVANADPADLINNDVESGSAVTVSESVSDIVDDVVDNVVSLFAADGSYVFDATALTAAADKEALTQAEVDSYFTISGSITKRTSSSGGVSSVELAKNAGSSISFTTDTDADVEFVVSSTGSSNTSAYALLDSTGTPVAAASGEVTGSANGKTTVTATLTAGTYTLVSPESSYNRGARVYSIVVTPAGSTVETESTTEVTETTTEVLVESTEASTEAPTEVSTEESSTEETTESGDLVGENFELWLDDIAYDVAGTAEDGSATVVKTIDPQTINYADSALTLLPGTDADVWTPSYSAAVGIVRNGRTVNGYKIGSRPAECNAFTKVPTEGSAVVFTPAEKGVWTVYFASSSFLRISEFTDPNAPAVATYDSAVSAESFSIQVVPGNTYVASTTGKTNNMAYAGFEYVIDEDVNVNISSNALGVQDYSNTTITLTDANLGTVTTSFKVSSLPMDVTLSKGHRYTVSTDDGGVSALVADSDTFKVEADGQAVTIDLNDIPDVTITGEITGVDSGVVTAMTFTNTVNGKVYDAVITGSTYTATVKPGDYKTTVVANGYTTYDRVKALADTENVNEVYVEVLSDDFKAILPTDIVSANPRLAYNGTVKAHNDTSVIASAGDTIVVPVKGKMVVKVAGWYSGTWDINGQGSVTADSSSSASNPVIAEYTTDGTETSVTVNITGAGSNYLYWISTETIPEEIAYKAEINVPGDFATLAEANAYINAMTREAGEAGRVTVNLTADVFEQVNWTAPYVTLNGNGHTISWYYGVGTFYYSIDDSGYYSETLFRDKYSSNEGNGSLWGGAFIAAGDNFIAENTTFKNTYNYSVTDKEKEDIASYASGMPDRLASDFNPSQFSAKERSNAFYIAADNIECYNCNILSSQDTLGRNGSTNNGYHTYFKDCVIGGNVDYICGEFAAVFDNCELQFKTYPEAPTNNAKVGYIVAPKTSPYVFRNCEITVDSDKYPVTGLYGRTWGAGSTAYFYNTETNGHISTDGWGQMSNGDFATANFNEYKNVSKGLEFASSTGSYVGNQVTDETMIGILTDTPDSANTITTILNGWTPKHYAYLSTEWTTETPTESTTEGTTLDPSGTADLSNGLVYGKNDNLLKGLFAGEDMPFYSGAENGEPADYVTGPTNPSKDGVSINGSQIATSPITLPNSGVYIAYTAPVDGTFSTLAKVNDGKTLVIADGNGNLIESRANSSGSSNYEPVEQHLNKGDTVYVFVQGSKARFFNISFLSDAAAETTTEATTEITTEGSTESTTALVGDSDYKFIPSSDGYDEGAEMYSDEYITVNASQRLNYRSLIALDTVGSNTYAGWVASTNVSTPMAIDGAAAANHRIAFTITAAQNCTVKIDSKVNGGKFAALVMGDETNGYTSVAKYDNSTGTTDDYVTLTANLIAGNTYYFAGRATNVPVYGITTSDLSILWGDVDDDGDVDATDAALVLQYTLNNSAVSILTDRADVSGNAIIDSEDATMILQKSLDSTYKFPVEPDEPVELPATTVYVVGDSTACHYINTKDDPAYEEGVTDLNDPYFWYKRVGFGDKIGDYLDPNATVVNLALSGRSSKSFATGINESGLTDEAAVANYAQLKNNIKEGDYLIIAFGHNDEKSDAYRYTSPVGDKDTAGSFQNSLYENYIKVAQDAGATPILCTPIIRSNASAANSDRLTPAEKHVTSEGDYGQAIKDLGAATGVTVIDNLQNTIDLFNLYQSELTVIAGTVKTSGPVVSTDEAGNTVVTDPTGYFRMQAADQGLGVDTTHLNNFGAKMVAYKFAQSLAATDNGLADYVLTDAAEPVFSNDDCYNPDWVAFDESNYTPSTIWKTTAPWAGSAFGSGIGSINEDSHSPFEIFESADGSVNLQVAGNKGKIASSEDGIVMYFQEIDANADFTLSATAHVNTYDASNNQSAFGLMLRDNMFSDYTYKTNAPYYAVGNTTQNSGKELVPVWRRTSVMTTVGEDGTEVNTPTVFGDKNLDKTVIGSAVETAADNAEAYVGKDVNLTISRTNGVVSVTYASDVLTGEYTFNDDKTDLTYIKADKDYVGVFVARAADVTFSNINFNNTAA